MKKRKLIMLSAVASTTTLLIGLFSWWFFFATKKVIIENDFPILIAENQNLTHHPLWPEPIPTGGYSWFAEQEWLVSSEENERFGYVYILVNQDIQPARIMTTVINDKTVTVAELDIIMDHPSQVPPLTQLRIFGDVYSTITYEVIIYRRTGEIKRVNSNIRYFAVNLRYKVINEDGTCNNYCDFD